MPRPPARITSPPKTMVFSMNSGGFWQVEGSPPLVGASGAPKINIFYPRNTKNQYFLIPEHQKSKKFVPGAPKINIFCPRSTKNQYFLSRSTKNQYFLSPEHQKSKFSVPGAPKINISVPMHQKSIFSVPGTPKMNILCPRSTKNQYSFVRIPEINIFFTRITKNHFFFSQTIKNQYFLSPEHQKSILPVRNRLTNNQTPSAVAGTQLCCALDPPRQAYGLRMAYGVPLP